MCLNQKSTHWLKRIKKVQVFRVVILLTALAMLIFVSPGHGLFILAALNFWKN